MTRARAVLVGILATGAIFIPTASQASATTYTIWGLEYCIPVLAGMGGWTAGCRAPSAGGGWARAIVTLNGLLFACLYVGAGFGMLSDPGCTALGLPSAYLVFGDPPALTVKVTGGATKIESSIAGVKLTVACTSAESKEMEIESGDKKTASKTKEKFVYKECKLESPNPKNVEGCKVKSGGKAAGTVETTALESELVENTAQTKVESLYKPQSGTTLSEVEFTECKNSGLNGAHLLKGSVLAEGGTEDEIANVKENEGEGDGEAVEKPKLNFEAASKKYLDDESKSEQEAKLEFGGSAATLKEEAKTESAFEGATFKSTESTEEVVVEKGVADLGLDKG